MSEITLQINGKTQTCLPATKLAQMLENLGMNPRLVAVEYNGEILHRQYWENTEIKEGDKLEIVTIVGIPIPPDYARQFYKSVGEKSYLLKL